MPSNGRFANQSPGQSAPSGGGGTLDDIGQLALQILQSRGMGSATNGQGFPGQGEGATIHNPYLNGQGNPGQGNGGPPWTGMSAPWTIPPGGYTPVGFNPQYNPTIGGGGVPPQVPYLGPEGGAPQASTGPRLTEDMFMANPFGGWSPRDVDGKGPAPRAPGLGNPSYPGAGGGMANNAPSQALMALLQLLRKSQQRQKFNQRTPGLGRPF